MHNMFTYASVFNQGPVYVVELRLRKWVGCGVQSPMDLFRSFHALGNRRGSKRQTNPPTHSLVHLTNQCTADIGAWDVSSVTDMRYMFHRADAFNQGPVYVVELRLRKLVGRGVQSPVDLFRSFHAPGNRRGSKRQTYPPTHSLVHLTNVPQTSVHGM